MYFVGVALVALLLAACGSRPAQSHGSPSAYGDLHAGASRNAGPHFHGDPNARAHGV